MGCDIHMYVEYKRNINTIEKWISGDYFKYNPFYKEWENEPEFSKIELHGNRNYALFTTLAGVRDYSNEVVPVSLPKGIPDDCCEYINKENKRWDGDGHTHSWLTLKELKDYQLSNPTLYRTGLLQPKALIEFDTKGTLPQSWCQGTNIKGYERRNWNEPNDTLIPLIDKLQKRGKELMQYDWEEWNPENDEKIRIVFWFDN